MTAAFFAGFCVLGIQSGINVAGVLVYPTSLRANGSGWQLGIGGLGSIVRPLLGALFVGLPVQQLYLWSAIPARRQDVGREIFKSPKSVPVTCVPVT